MGSEMENPDLPPPPIYRRIFHVPKGGGKSESYCTTLSVKIFRLEVCRLKVFRFKVFPKVTKMENFLPESLPPEKLSTDKVSFFEVPAGIYASSLNSRILLHLILCFAIHCLTKN
jgi:hypothetical protein